MKTASGGLLGGGGARPTRPMMLAVTIVYDEFI
jgi:hypothetical protein